MYTLDQEAATADEKETDIRLRATQSPQQATIELKIGEKPRSAENLRDALKDQLVQKYMAADDCRAGCLLVTICSDKKWMNPDTGKRINFTELIAFLNEAAVKITSDLGGEIRLMAKGLDLRPRLGTEHSAAKAKRARKSPAAKKGKSTAAKKASRHKAMPIKAKKRKEAKPSPKRSSSRHTRKKTKRTKRAKR